MTRGTDRTETGRSEPATVHLVVGSTGAGKSTYAAALAGEIGGVHFAIDQWVARLFGPDQPEPLELDWMLERIERAKEQIWDLTVRLARADTPAILEVGLTSRRDREAIYRQAAAAGLRIALHVLDVPAEVRWHRVKERNRLRGDTFFLEVTREMFDLVETMWEAPGRDEIDQWDGVAVAGGARPLTKP